MAKLFNSSSNSPIQVSRRVKKIVSQIQSLIKEFPDCCWYDGSWWCGNGSVITETECLAMTYAADGLHFWFADFYGDHHFTVLPYDAKLLSRLRNLQQKIWVSTWRIVSGKKTVKKTVPAWALKRGCYPHI